MEPFKVTEIVVSPCIMCPCGKSILRMTEEQRAQYDEAVSKRCETKGRETLPLIECATNDTNLDTTHDDEMETKKYDSLYP